MTDPEYPPFASFDSYPLHGWDYGKPYACQGGTNQYDWRCPNCVSTAQSEVMHDRDVVVLWKPDADQDERRVRLSWLVARSRALGVKD